jgi:pyruvate formate lyase activating enzyme
VNDDVENMNQSAKFIAGLPGQKRKVNLLPYHHIASKKYEKLGLESAQEEFEAPDIDAEQRIIEVFGSYGIDAVIGG